MLCFSCPFFIHLPAHLHTWTMCTAPVAHLSLSLSSEIFPAVAPRQLLTAVVPGDLLLVPDAHRLPAPVPTPHRLSAPAMVDPVTATVDLAPVTMDVVAATTDLAAVTVDPATVDSPEVGLLLLLLLDLRSRIPASSSFLFANFGGLRKGRG